ncbi:MAG: hypothetical protein ABIS86_04615 [Streptosporangiaceae bacterium]
MDRLTRRRRTTETRVLAGLLGPVLLVLLWIARGGWSGPDRHPSGAASALFGTCLVLAAVTSVVVPVVLVLVGIRTQRALSRVLQACCVLTAVLLLVLTVVAVGIDAENSSTSTLLFLCAVGAVLLLRLSRTMDRLREAAA